MYRIVYVISVFLKGVLFFAIKNTVISSECTEKYIAKFVFNVLFFPFRFALILPKVIIIQLPNIN